jgi:hypothetical protein
MFRAINLWLPAYLRQRAWQPPAGKVVDLMVAVCDHFEPFHATDKAGAIARMNLWNDAYPKLISKFRDADGCHPRHTFFYPIEQYDEDILNSLAELVKKSGGEAELHLHHKDDTPEGLRSALEQGKADFLKHGLLSRDAQGRVVYGFVHGNWALDNSHPEGKNCGVNEELSTLKASGCFADFTMPSAPDPTQTRIINQLYYAADTPRPKSHDQGVRAHVHANGGQAVRDDSLLLIQGPLGLNWEKRKFGFLPRLENADLTGANPPRLDRLRVWLKQGIHVAGRPEWLFIKLHSHGAVPRNSSMLLGDPMARFHQALLASHNDGAHYRVHYVTAREMVNILHAAEDGMTGNPGQYRDYRYRLVSGRTFNPPSASSL